MSTSLKLKIDFLKMPLLEDEEKNEPVELGQNSQQIKRKDISMVVPSDSPAKFNTRSERNDLVRICVLSILLSIGYTFNFISVIKLNKTQIKIADNIWAIIYLSSIAWLFVACCVMIIITLVSFTTNKLGFKQSLCKRVLLCCLFFTGTCGQITSLIIARRSNKNHKYIFWEYEIIYTLLPIYIIILMLLFQKTDVRDVKIKMLKFAIFSVILFITPFLRLLAIMKTTVFSSETTEPLIISAYSSVCAATIVLALVHIIYFIKHYNSGVLIKLIIICLLTYSIIVCITKKNIKIEFDKYEEIKSKSMEYRIYYYYALQATLYLVYTFEMFIKVPPKYSRDTTFLPHIQQRESYFPMQDMATDKKVQAVIKAFPDYKPVEDNKDNYFNEITFDNSSVEQERLKDSIAAIVPFYNESASEIHATLRSLYFNFEYIKRKRSKYQFTHFNVLLVGDGWFKSDISTKRYLTKLYNLTDIDDSFKQANQDIIRSKKEKEEKEEKEPDKTKKNKKKKQAYTVILQTKYNKPVCINPFNNGEEDIYLKVTTIIKIDNRKKANSHEWFLGEYGFAEWVQCDYMYFTDAYSTINKEGLYKMVMHMKKPINKDVVCCTGRARVYTIEQEIDFKLLLKEKRSDSDSDCNKKVGLPSSILYQESKELEQINPGWDAEIFYDPRHDTQEKRWWQEDKDENVFYRIQDIEYDYRLSVNAHLRQCQMFEFEALYGTIGAYLLGGFLPVIPGPCGFYRSSYLLKDEVRGWYFDKIHQENTWDDMDLVLGNMKLAEDRILTVTSILNCDEPVRHSLLPEVVFYFDPMPSLKQLMKQRRRWINGSIATIIFVLRKISFQTWNVNWFRRIYVLTIWHMQLFMFVVLYLSPPLLFIIAFKYGLATILNALLVDHGEGKKYNYVNTTVNALMVMSWVIYVLFIYFAQSPDRKPNKKKRNIDEDDCILCCFSCKKKVKRFNCLTCDLTVNKDIPSDKKIKWNFKPKIVRLMLSLSYGFGLLTVIGSFVSFGHLLLAITVNTSEIFDNSFNFFVLIIETVFFLQSFVLAPLFSKDIKTLEILLKSGVAYFMYAPFYVIFFFINAIANVHDLSWGTRPDDVDAETGNKKAKYTTYGILIVLLMSNIVMSIVFQPFTEGTYARIIFFAILSLPALFQIFFSLVWLIKERFVETINACLPRKIDEQVDYQLDLSFDVKKIN